MNKHSRVENVLTLSALGLVVIGCLTVLAPFVSALLWAVILSFSTWGLYERVLTLLGHRRGLSAFVMTLGLALVLLVPVVIVGAQLGENLDHIAGAGRSLLDSGLPPAPAWLRGLPGIGGYLESIWNTLPGASPTSMNGTEAIAWIKAQAKPISGWLLQRGLDVGQALLQLTLSVFASFYFYRDGVQAVARLRAGMERIAGKRAQALIDLAARTIRGVVYGILGTALAQGITAAIGFSIAGVPGPLLLGVATFVVSIIPAGPPLIWIPAALWLLNEGHAGWALFMTGWGVLLISGVDNVVRPWLISQGAALPFLLVLLGVIGGLLTFGFIGVFLGPTLLAVGYAMLREWTRLRESPGPIAPPGL
jgi:predicted PurR-regulated permease PerM